MDAILVWPNKTPNGKYEDEPMDNFWVECSVDEAEAAIVPGLSGELLLRYQDISRRSELAPPDMKGKRFFVISRNGLDIAPREWYYPFSGQWNGRCPFLCMRKKTVRDLTGLQDTAVKLINYANWKKKNPRASAAQDLITASFY